MSRGDLGQDPLVSSLPHSGFRLLHLGQDEQFGMEHHRVGQCSFGVVGRDGDRAGKLFVDDGDIEHSLIVLCYSSTRAIVR